MDGTIAITAVLERQDSFRGIVGLTLLVLVLKGGTIAILTALERPDSFAGIMLSAPAVAETPPSGCKVSQFITGKFMSLPAPPHWKKKFQSEKIIYRLLGTGQ